MMSDLILDGRLLQSEYVDIAGYQLFVVNTIEEVERFFFGNLIIAEF